MIIDIYWAVSVCQVLCWALFFYYLACYNDSLGGCYYYIYLIDKGIRTQRGLNSSWSLVKGLATKSGNLNSVPRTYMVEGEI